MKMYLVKMARWREIAFSVTNRKLNFETQPSFEFDINNVIPVNIHNIFFAYFY